MNRNDPFWQCFECARAYVAGNKNHALQVPIGFLNDLSNATNREAVLAAYSSWSKQIVAAERCSIAIESGDDALEMIAMTGPSGIPPNSRYAIAESLSGAVFRASASVYIDDPSNVVSPGVEMLSKLGYKAIAVVPLLTQARCIGVISASFKTEPDDPGLVLTTLEAIGRCLAMQLQLIDQMAGLEKLAHTDPLTGAKNRYELYNQAGKAWADWTDDGQPFCYIAVDVDHFKEVNDTYGHDVGDQVLCTLVNRLSARVRQADGVIRSGGEEFGLLVNDCELRAAAKQAHRLCDAIGDTPFVIRDTFLQVTASFGVTQVLSQDQDFSDVLKRADQALYQAKAMGRDQVVSDDGKGLAA